MSMGCRWYELFGRQSGFRKTEAQSEQVQGFIDVRTDMGIGSCRLRPHRDDRRDYRCLGFRTGNVVRSSRRRHSYGKRRRRRQLRRVVRIGHVIDRRSYRFGNVSAYRWPDGIRRIHGHCQPGFRDIAERKTHHSVQQRLRIRFQAFVFGRLRRRVQFRIRHLGRNVWKPSGVIVAGGERHHDGNPLLAQRRGNLRNYGNVLRKNRETNVYGGRNRQPSRSGSGFQRRELQLRRNAGRLSQMLGRQFERTTLRRNHRREIGSRGRYRFDLGSVEGVGRGQFRLRPTDERDDQMLGIQRVRPALKMNRRQFFHPRCRKRNSFGRDPDFHMTAPRLRDRLLSGEMLGAELRLPALKFQRLRRVRTGSGHRIDDGSDGHLRRSRAHLRGRERRSEMLGQQFFLPALRRNDDGKERSSRFRRIDLGHRFGKRRSRKFMCR